MELPLNVGLEKVGLPLVVTDDIPNLTMLIDTGATHNILFSYVYEVLGKRLIPLSAKTTIRGLEGRSITCPQVNTTLRFGDKEFPVVFTIMEDTSSISKLQEETGVQIHGILGIPFLTDNKWIINFDNLTINTSDYVSTS